MFLDLVRFFTAGGKALPYDPWTTHAITVTDLEACAAAQGVVFRCGDILLLRVGFMQRWYAKTTSQEEREGLKGKPEAL